MTLTLANAATVHDHHDPTESRRGYTCTGHHAGYLSPGDLWNPDQDRPPCTVTAVHWRYEGVTLIDQYGNTSRYPIDAIVPTAVADPWPRPAMVPGRSARVRSG
jgi:hypothetical protein